MKITKPLIFGCVCLISFFTILNSIKHIMAEYHHRQGFIKQSKGYPNLANYNYKKAVNLIPWENHYRLQLAKSFESTANRSQGKYNKYIELAIKEYMTLLSIDNINPWYKARLGILYHDRFNKYGQINDKINAEKYALAATNSDPKNPLFTLHFAHFLYTYNKIDEATKYYKKTIEYDNDMLEAHFNLGAIYFEKKQIEVAMSHYKKITERLPSIESNFRINPTKEYEEKIKRYQNARIRLADYYLSQNKLVAAYELISLVPVSIEKYELLASYYEKMKQFTSAISIYEQLNQRLEENRYDSQIKRLKRL
ncbi:MAG: tetratricopeptide repeat protein [Candidatus Marinamargulisbacteria bacterium]